MSSSGSPVWLYPKECNICSKFRVQHRNKKFEPYKIATYDTQRTIKAAANAKDKKLYSEIESLDLIAKEFKVHAHCYQNFTRGFSDGSSTSSSTKTAPAYDSGDFDAVKEIISNEVISLGKAVSMKNLHVVYGLSIEDTRYRSKLKQRIINLFGDKLLFLNPSVGNGEVVVSAECLDGGSFCEQDVIKKAANIIRDRILKKFKDVAELNWPPTTEELSSNARQPPDLVYTFLNHLMKLDGNHASLSYNPARLVESYAHDLVHGVTRGKVMQKKHFLLGLGLHNLTGLFCYFMLKLS